MESRAPGPQAVVCKGVALRYRRVVSQQIGKRAWDKEGTGAAMAQGGIGGSCFFLGPVDRHNPSSCCH